MLPSSKRALVKGGLSKQEASWALLGCFIGGFIGIQILSRFLHQYIPSHVEHCDHSHDEESNGNGLKRKQSRGRSKGTANGKSRKPSEQTPLLASQSHTNGGQAPPTIERRPSMQQVQKRVMSFVRDTKPNCDSQGPCYGYTDVCGQECQKTGVVRTSSTSRHSTMSRKSLANIGHIPSPVEEEPSTNDISATRHQHDHDDHDHDHNDNGDDDVEAQHHHHVAENAYMSIGLQTSIAIALHKIPEGFITYATNHANPSLGFSVFMALFIHNISEGFALALPLYLAIRNRAKAMFWAAILGGASQPLGAGIAALWFKVAGKDGHAPGETVYGCMFGVTSGIMASVALQLFAESLTTGHNRNLCIGFGFVGMGIMAMSNALTA